MLLIKGQFFLRRIACTSGFFDVQHKNLIVVPVSEIIYLKCFEIKV